MRSALLVVVATLVAVPPAAGAQMPPRAPGPPADLRAARLVTAGPRRPAPPRDGWRPPSPRPPSPRPPAGRPRVPRAVRPALIVVGPYGALAGAFGYLPFPAPAVAPIDGPTDDAAASRAPRTRVIEVGEAAPADTACGWATHARALMECAAAALQREDERLATATARARERLRRTRPAAALAAFDAAAGSWAEYRDRECRARTLALGAADERSYHALACQLRLARERRALLDPDD